MPIDPIKIFQGGESSIAGILQGGNSTITSILDKAVQIGRDISNKQMRQEEDMLSMRQQETALQQRRAENLSQDWEDVFRFTENRRQFDTKFDRATMEDERNFAANRSDAAWSQQRAAEQDILRSEQWNKEFGLREDSAQREERRLGLAEDKITKQERFDRDLLASQPAQRRGLLGVVDRVSSFFGKEPPVSESEAAAKRDAAVRLGDAPAALKYTRQLDDISAAKENQLTTYQKESLEMRRQALEDQSAAKTEKANADEAARQQKERQQWLEDTVRNPSAFPSQFAHVKSTASTYGSDPASQSNYAAELAQARDIDKNRLNHEAGIARESKTADEYANRLKGATVTPEVLDLRRRFWYEVKRSEEAGKSSSDGIPGKPPVSTEESVRGAFDIPTRKDDRQ